MRTKLEIRDRSKTRDRVTGYSLDNMVRRMFGSTAYTVGHYIAEGDVLTVCKGDGRVVGSIVVYNY